MLVLEAKLNGKEVQYGLIDEAIRAALFCRNKALRYWMDNKKVSGYDLNKQMAVLAKEFDFANKLGSQARQSSAEPVQNELGLLFLSSTPIVKRKYLARKVSLISRNVEIQLNTKRLDGLFLTIGNT